MEYPQIKRVIEVVKKLRDPDSGCPWDLKQDHQTLLKYLIEESYEFKHSVETGDTEEMEKELGDVFFQVLLHSQIAAEENNFDLESVSKKLADKMIYRHPHVFNPDAQKLSSEEVIKNWDILKQKEKSNESKTFFTQEDLAMPSLMSAQKIGAKSAKVNFDWDNHSQVLDKVQEEWDEVKAELHDIENNKDRIKDEIGDLLFSVTQLARHLEIDAEDALRGANKKFIKRFSVLETLINEDQKDIQKLSVPQLEEYWSKVKKQLNKSSSS
jgi:MazG family protein